jgi:hypothetical protein
VVIGVGHHVYLVRLADDLILTVPLDTITRRASGLRAAIPRISCDGRWGAWRLITDDHRY